jgi:drug/metabolite transporter (DMT)-like permease
MNRFSAQSATRRRIPNRIEWGIALALAAALISGLAIYLNAFAVKQVQDPAVYTTLKNAVAAAILVGAVLVIRRSEPSGLSRANAIGVLLVGVIGGSIPFVLFFTGLAQASAPSAAFIQKTLFLWVAALAVPFLGERLGLATLLGLAGLLAGQALVLPPTGMTWGTGETLILAATALWAIETVLARRLLASVASEVLGALRLSIGVVVLFGYLLVTGKLGSLADLTTSQWTWIVATGAILAAYVATWFAALKRAPASVVTSVLVVGAVVTGVLTSASRGAAPSPTVVVGYGLIVAATILVVASARLAATSLAAATDVGGLVPSPARPDAG